MPSSVSEEEAFLQAGQLKNISHDIASNGSITVTNEVGRIWKEVMTTTMPDTLSAFVRGTAENH
jgi:hypothetical protein